MGLKDLLFSREKYSLLCPAGYDFLSTVHSTVMLSQ